MSHHSNQRGNRAKYTGGALSKGRKVKYGIAAVAAVAACVGIYFGATHLESYLRSRSENVQAQQAEQEDLQNTSNQVYYNNAWYEPNDQVSAYLIMGVDTDGTIEETTKAAQSDFNLVLVLDDENKEYTLLQLNRDTMMDVPVLGALGESAGSKYEQLALGHTYGSGKQDSCENQQQAVSNLLYGVTFDGYLAANMDAVAIMNDQVGGVTVTIEEDFSEVDPSLVKGQTMTLKGDQALTYVRSRYYVDDNTNLSRMKRQATYMSALVQQIGQKMNGNPQFAVTLFGAIQDYIVSDMDGNRIGGMAQKTADYDDKGIITIDGEAKKGEKFMEYYVDEDDLKQKVVNLFYKPVGKSG